MLFVGKKCVNFNDIIEEELKKKLLVKFLICF